VSGLKKRKRKRLRTLEKSKRNQKKVGRAQPKRKAPENATKEGVDAITVSELKKRERKRLRTFEESKRNQKKTPKMITICVNKS